MSCIIYQQTYPMTRCRRAKNDTPVRVGNLEKEQPHIQKWLRQAETSAVYIANGSRNFKKGEDLLKNNLFVTANEVLEELGILKPFAYKLVRQMNEELAAKGFITIAGRVSRKYYEEKLYGMAKAN